ncbi:hypothetical protein M422DRAFT_245622 [Sphaerobolus stellatus SS14]|nr:hypothetical protein M422DRAFT_245622 [Sphaerobolus stellatus SS14]
MSVLKLEDIISEEFLIFTESTEMQPPSLCGFQLPRADIISAYRKTSRLPFKKTSPFLREGKDSCLTPSLAQLNSPDSPISDFPPSTPPPLNDEFPSLALFESPIESCDRPRQSQSRNGSQPYWKPTTPLRESDDGRRICDKPPPRVIPVAAPVKASNECRVASSLPKLCQQPEGQGNL